MGNDWGYHGIGPVSKGRNSGHAGLSRISDALKVKLGHRRVSKDLVMAQQNVFDSGIRFCSER